MSSTNKTGSLGLNQWVLEDPPLMEDFNADNVKIDEALQSVNSKLNALPFVKIREMSAASAAAQVSLNVTGIDFSRYSRIELKICIPNGGLTDISSIRMYPNEGLVADNLRVCPSDKYNNDQWQRKNANDTIDTDPSAACRGGFGTCCGLYRFSVDGGYMYIRSDANYYTFYRYYLPGGLTTLKLMPVKTTETYSASAQSYSYATAFTTFPAGTRFIFYGVKL